MTFSGLKFLDSSLLPPLSHSLDVNTHTHTRTHTHTPSHSPVETLLLWQPFQGVVVLSLQPSHNWYWMWERHSPELLSSSFLVPHPLLCCSRHQIILATLPLVTLIYWSCVVTQVMSMKLALLGWEPLFTCPLIFMDDGACDLFLWLRNIGETASSLCCYSLNFLFYRQ